MPEAGRCLQQEVFAEDRVLKLLSEGGDDGSHQRTGAVTDEEANELVVGHDLLLGVELLHAKVGAAKVLDLLHVHLLGGGAASLVKDLVDIQGGPGAHFVEIVAEGGLEPGLNGGHVEVVGQNVGLDQVGNHGGGLANVVAGSGTAGQEGQVKTLEVLNANLGETKNARARFLPRAREKGSEVGRVINK